MSNLSCRLLLTISLLAIAGIAVSSVSLYHHYGSAKTSYCDIGENFNCDIVNRSADSSLLGVPVALIGILGYLALLALSTIRAVSDLHRRIRSGSLVHPLPVFPGTNIRYLCTLNGLDGKTREQDLTCSLSVSAFL